MEMRKQEVMVPATALTMEVKSVDYVRFVVQEQDREDLFMILSYLLSDRRIESSVRALELVCWLMRKTKWETRGSRRYARIVGSVTIDGSLDERIVPALHLGP